MTEETVDKKVSRKTAREWRKDLMSRSKRNLPGPHSNKKAKRKSIDRFYDAMHSGKFRGLTDTSQLASYFGKGKELKGGGRAVMKKGGKV